MAEQNVFNLMQNDEIGLLWKKIYQLHQKTKIYLLTAEEISENGDALIQPLKEHRDAYDHIVRIFASIDRLRKKFAGKRPDVHMADVMEEMEQLNVTYTVEEQLAEKELMETINRFLEEMSPKDRNIFVRRYWFLDPVSAISKRHHMSAGSVKMNLYRNRKKLLKLLEKEGGRI